MLRKKISWTAPHSPAECCELLKPWIDTSFIKFGGQPYVGKVTDSKLVLRKRIRYNNGFQTTLEAKMLAGPEQKQTRLVGHIGLRGATLLFVAFWTFFVLLGVVFLTIPATRAYLSGHTDSVNGNFWVGIFVPPGMIFFMLSLVSFGRWLARREEIELTNFMQRTIHAIPNPSC